MYVDIYISREKVEIDRESRSEWVGVCVNKREGE